MISSASPARVRPSNILRCILSWNSCLCWHKINNKPSICVTTGIPNWHCTHANKQKFYGNLVKCRVSVYHYGTHFWLNLGVSEHQDTKTLWDRRLWSSAFHFLLSKYYVRYFPGRGATHLTHLVCLRHCQLIYYCHWIGNPTRLIAFRHRRWSPMTLEDCFKVNDCIKVVTSNYTLGVLLWSRTNR